MFYFTCAVLFYIVCFILLFDADDSDNLKPIDDGVFETNNYDYDYDYGFTMSTLPYISNLRVAISKNCSCAAREVFVVCLSISPR